MTDSTANEMIQKTVYVFLKDDALTPHIIPDSGHQHKTVCGCDLRHKRTRVATEIPDDWLVCQDCHAGYYDNE